MLRLLPLGLAALLAAACVRARAAPDPAPPTGARHVALALERPPREADVLAIERVLGALPGVTGLQVAVGSRALELDFEPGQVALIEILSALRAVGQSAEPAR